MKQDRREFLKKSLKVGAVAGVVATPLAAKVTSEELTADGNGVVVGTSNKKEVLYHKSLAWEKFYKVAY
ncbi:MULTISPECIES: Tat pathway signal protein [Campylobacter]|uniref:Tat pathway signal protein n=1 Tax=Campylobacter suis TaxID=2790657 RepID=A0ABM8Q8Q8_9BACT|nr:Tat pathway signal protein [Campylobacter suis]CAD7289223.1 hypothetical protein LMG8286_01700 [Campylobacter suis]